MLITYFGDLWVSFGVALGLTLPTLFAIICIYGEGKCELLKLFILIDNFFACWLIALLGWSASSTFSRQLKLMGLQRPSPPSSSTLMYFSATEFIDCCSSMPDGRTGKSFSIKSASWLWWVSTSIWRPDWSFLQQLQNLYRALLYLRVRVLLVVVWVVQKIHQNRWNGQHGDQLSSCQNGQGGENRKQGKSQDRRGRQNEDPTRSWGKQHDRSMIGYGRILS